MSSLSRIRQSLHYDAHLRWVLAGGLNELDYLISPTELKEELVPWEIFCGDGHLSCLACRIMRSRGNRSSIVMGIVLSRNAGSESSSFYRVV